jgi:hypothetical protein
MVLCRKLFFHPQKRDPQQRIMHRGRQEYLEGGVKTRQEVVIRHLPQFCFQFKELVEVLVRGLEFFLCFSMNVAA